MGQAYTPHPIPYTHTSPCIVYFQLPVSLSEPLMRSCMYMLPFFSYWAVGWHWLNCGVQFDDLLALTSKTTIAGYYGGLRLLRAACKKSDPRRPHSAPSNL